MRVYVCSSLKPQAKKRRDKLLATLTVCPSTVFFLPNGNNRGKMKSIVSRNVKEIESCDELWVVSTFGRDCSWEIGYAMALGKQIKIFKDFSNKDSLYKDWMYRIGFEKGLLEVINCD